MNYKLRAYSIWEFGQRIDAAGNPHQEDSMYPPFGRATDADRLFIVCDGMGGHDAGEVASEAVCQAMAKSILSAGRSTEGTFTDQDLAHALDAAYNALDERDSGAARKMGTTMTLLKLHSMGATIAHIGDSRVYHFRPGATADDTYILHATSDHSLVNELVRAGQMTHEEAMMSGQKNIITRAMQPGLDPRPHADVYHTADIQAGDWFLLCSDGILEHPQLEDGSYLRHLFSAAGGDDQQKVDTLVAATINNSDNHTAILVHILDVQDPSGIRATGILGQGEVVGVLPEAPKLAPGNGGKPWAEAGAPAGTKKSNSNNLIVKGAVAAIAAFAVLCGAFFAYRAFSGDSEAEGQITTEEPTSNGKVDDKEIPAATQLDTNPDTEPQEEQIITVEESEDEAELISSPEEVQLDLGTSGNIIQNTANSLGVNSADSVNVNTIVNALTQPDDTTQTHPEPF